MKLLFKLIIKDKHKPPEFKEGCGKGVLVTLEVDLPDNMSEIQLGRYYADMHSELIKEFIDVVCEEIE